MKNKRNARRPRTAISKVSFAPKKRREEEGGGACMTQGSFPNTKEEPTPPRPPRPPRRKIRGFKKRREREKVKKRKV